MALSLFGACSASTRAAAGGSSYSVGARGDARLAQDIRAALRYDERLSGASRDIDVQVKGGVATLTGKVATAEEDTVIQETAARFAGAGHVKNHLIVETMPAGSAEPATPFLQRPVPDVPMPPPDQPENQPQSIGPDR